MLHAQSPSITFKRSRCKELSIDGGDGGENITHFKNEFTSFYILSRLFQFALNVKWGTALSLEREREGERKIRRRLFTSSIKREIRHLHVVYSCRDVKEKYKKV